MSDLIDHALTLIDPQRAPMCGHPQTLTLEHGTVYGVRYSISVCYRCGSEIVTTSGPLPTESYRPLA
jgi:hypothetical protein